MEGKNVVGITLIPPPPPPFSIKTIKVAKFGQGWRKLLEGGEGGFYFALRFRKLQKKRNAKKR